MSKQIGGSHYKMPIEPIEFIVKNDIPYREANVIKYVCRHKLKNGKEDIKKAIHYLEMILEDYEKDVPTPYHNLPPDEPRPVYYSPRPDDGDERYVPSYPYG